MSKLKFAVLLAPLLTVASLASADVRVYLHDGPPRAIVERRAPRPDRGAVWIAGYHRWDGGSYNWVPGHWEAAPRRGARWRGGNWRRDRQRGWYWTEGGWR